LDEEKKNSVRETIRHRCITMQKKRLLASTGQRLSSRGAEVRRRLLLKGERALRLRQVIALGQRQFAREELAENTEHSEPN